MREFEQRRHPARLLGKRLITVGLLIALALAIKGAWGVHEKKQETDRLRKEAEAKMMELSERSEALAETVAKLKTEEGIEAELRRQFEVGKEGEGVIIVMDGEPISPEVATSTKWWKKLKGAE
ncbi:MAG: septum formation initiator family protein [Candidatus Pacebacteria bacterium]|nr:septum formation initiator family protein [Candidatus Paceibacterota bacterium]